MRTKLLLLTVTAALLFGAIANVSAQAPTTFLYQGRLTDANSQPITAATSVIFAVVSGPSGMVISLYDTVATVTPNDNGVFTIELGPMPESAFTGGKRYLAVTVGGTELLPRQLITSVPYAMSSGDAPGIASKNLPASFFYPGAASATPDIVDSLEITVPTSGYVEVFCFASWVNVAHTTGTNTEMRMGASPSTTLNLDYGGSVFRIPATAPTTGSWAMPMISRQLFAVSAGTHKFYFLFQYMYGADVSPSIGRPYMSGTFYSARYGDVDSAVNTAPANGGITAVVEPTVIEDLQVGNNAAPAVDMADRVRLLEEQVQQLLERLNKQ